MEPRRRLALAQGTALPGLSQTPRSLQHTSHIKRKQVTQMRQMVLVCDDSCNSFSSSPPPLFCPLGFPLVSPLFFAPKRPCCATQAGQALSVGLMGIKTRTPGSSSDTRLHMWHGYMYWCKGLSVTHCILPLHFILMLVSWMSFLPTSAHYINQRVGKVDPPVFYQ